MNQNLIPDTISWGSNCCLYVWVDRWSWTDRKFRTNYKDKIGRGHKKERNDKSSCSIMKNLATQCCRLAILNCKVTARRTSDSIPKFPNY